MSYLKKIAPCVQKLSLAQSLTKNSRWRPRRSYWITSAICFMFLVFSGILQHFSACFGKRRNKNLLRAILNCGGHFVFATVAILDFRPSQKNNRHLPLSKDKMHAEFQDNRPLCSKVIVRKRKFKMATTAAILDV